MSNYPYQVHWTEGGGLPGLPKGLSRGESGSLESVTFKVRELQLRHTEGKVHSISVWDVTGDRRDNVTDTFVRFDSRPRRPDPSESAVAALGRKIQRAAYK